MTVSLQSAFATFKPLDAMERTSLFLCQHLLKEGEATFYRTAFSPGHFCGSAWVVNPSHTKVLLMFHKAYGEWYQFGGHADGDANLFAVALRELLEESGIAEGLITIPSKAIFDVDVHYIAEKMRKGLIEPAHLHYDVRYRFVVDDTLPLPPSPEGIEMRWMTLAEAQAIFPLGQGRWRMAEKTKALQAA